MVQGQVGRIAPRGLLQSRQNCRRSAPRPPGRRRSDSRPRNVRSPAMRLHSPTLNESPMPCPRPAPLPRLRVRRRRRRLRACPTYAFVAAARAGQRRGAPAPDRDRRRRHHRPDAGLRAGAPRRARRAAGRGQHGRRQGRVVARHLLHAEVARDLRAARHLRTHRGQGHPVERGPHLRRQRRGLFVRPAPAKRLQPVAAAALHQHPAVLHRGLPGRAHRSELGHDDLRWCIARRRRSSRPTTCAAARSRRPPAATGSRPTT